MVPVIRVSVFVYEICSHGDEGVLIRGFGTVRFSTDAEKDRRFLPDSEVLRSCRGDEMWDLTR